MPVRLPQDLWLAWSFDPLIAIGLGIAAGFYLRGGRLHRSGWRELGAFAAGWLALFIALVSPLHAAAGALFSAHMIQHELLMLIAAPLLALGRPEPVALRWAPEPLLRPVVAWLAHALALWCWHAPALFDAAVRSEAIHTAQHLSFFESALLFWWSLLRVRSGYGVAILYVFTTAVHNTLLGMLLTLSPVAWYRSYAATTAAWGLTPLEDQQVGGLIMWVPAGIVYIIAGLAFAAAWIQRLPASQRQGSVY